MGRLKKLNHRIISIKPQRTKNRFNITLESGDVFGISEDVLISSKLSEGKYVSDKELGMITNHEVHQKIKEKVSAFNGDVIVSQFDGNNSDITLNPIPKNQDFYPDFDSVPEVSHVQVTATKAGVIRTPTDFEGIIVKGVGADYRWDYIKEFLVEGRLPDFSGKLNTEILISTYLANRLGFKNGDKVIVFFLKEDGGFLNRRFDIVGIYDSGFQEFDETYLFADIRHIQKLNKWEDDQVGAFEVFVDDFDKIDEIGVEIYKNTDSFLNTMTIKQKYYSIFEWLSLFDFNIALIIAVMIIVAGINMIVALLVLILERTPMVGILKALGASDWSIRKIFMYNALYLVGVGLFWGNVYRLLCKVSCKI